MSTLCLIGGTGSLGRAVLAHQDLLESHGIKRIRILSRDEIKQDALEKSYSGSIEIQCVLGDIRSKDRIEMALEDVDYLIHAAALKIVPKFEYDIAEGICTNVTGTENVLKAFLKKPQAKSAIFVSTDKAADPLNAYGFSKALAERLWLWGMMIQDRVKLGVCRYGNVFGSRGSVIEAWQKRLLLKKPLPITSDTMTRFFISITEASRLVLEELFSNDGGEIVIPTMESIEMTLLGELLCRLHDYPADFERIGIREGEKIHECLTSVNEKYIFLKRGEQDRLRLRPLSKQVSCYRQERIPQYLVEPVNSKTSHRLSEQKLEMLYKEWQCLSSAPPEPLALATAQSSVI
jgi:UDP-N-acetylglucosamine 4,6-dehydratase